MCVAGGNVSRVATAEDGTAVPQNLKQNDHVTQQSHFEVYMQKNRKQKLEQILVPPCLALLAVAKRQK